MGDQLLVDTGFFTALYHERDSHHAPAVANQDWLDTLPVVLPWPVLYETINTRLTRRPHLMARFDALVSASQTTLLDDSPYRQECYRSVMTPKGQAPSLVDAILQCVVEDANVPIGAMLTFNHRDFAGLCAQYQVELLC